MANKENPRDSLGRGYDHSIWPPRTSNVPHNEQKTQEDYYKERDRLWCQAACEVLDIAEIAKLMQCMLKLRNGSKVND